jgi:hypothetical protein
MAAGHKTGGRQRGTPNKLTSAARAAFEAAFEGIGGVEQLTAWGRENPTEFYKLYGRLIPVESQLSGPNGGPIEHLVNETITRGIKPAASGLPGSGVGRADTGDNP